MLAIRRLHYWQSNNHTAYVHIGSLAHYEAREALDEEFVDAPQWAVDEVVDMTLTETVLHELRHEIDDANAGAEAIIDEMLNHLMKDAKPSRFTRLLRRMAKSKWFDEESRSELEDLVTKMEASDGQRQLEKYMVKDKVPHDVYLGEPSEIRAREFSETLANGILDGDRNYPIVIDLQR